MSNIYEINQYYDKKLKALSNYLNVLAKRVFYIVNQIEKFY